MSRAARPLATLRPLTKPHSVLAVRPLHLGPAHRHQPAHPDGHQGDRPGQGLGRWRWRRVMSPLDKAPRTGISPRARRKRKPTGTARPGLLAVEKDEQIPAPPPPTHIRFPKRTSIYAPPVGQRLPPAHGGHSHGTCYPCISCASDFSGLGRRPLENEFELFYGHFSVRMCPPI